MHVSVEVREVLLGAKMWYQEHGSLPPSVGVLFFERRVEAPDFDHWCVRGWDEPVTVAGVMLTDWERGIVTDADALRAARAMTRPDDGWEQVGYHWYCLREEAWEVAPAKSAVAFALTGPVLVPGTLIQVGFADGDVETVMTDSHERWAAVKAALAARGLALPVGLEPYVGAER